MNKVLGEARLENVNVTKNKLQTFQEFWQNSYRSPPPLFDRVVNSSVMKVFSAHFE
jgi:hypothetical protein